MKLAILSDIHGNNEALQAVLADIDDQHLGDIICLGDSIGYGPDPESVIQEILRRKIPSIIGNHEMAVCDRAHLDWFNPLARRSLEITIEMLSAESFAYIKELPYSRVVSGSRFVHGYPPDSARTYLFRQSVHQLHKTLQTMSEAICFVGHTHDLELIEFNGHQVERSGLKEGVSTLDVNHRYIINVGSVGQPRDGTNHAKYVIWDTTAGSLEVKFIAYDIATTVAKIKAANLPESHARRLW